MLLFCPTCGNILHVESGISNYRFACNTCPYVFNISQRITSRTYPKLKEVDDVLGGSAAWENVDATDERCPRCSHPRAYFMQIQTRSADEPMTTFYRCCNAQCSHNWWIMSSDDSESNPAMSPMKQTLKAFEMQLKTFQPSYTGFWLSHGSRNVARAVRLLQEKRIIALPTDTVYGLAGLAQSNESIKKLYEIKQRDPSKPLAICVGEIADVKSWGIVDSLPAGLLESLFPGPVTLVLKRTAKLNPIFNPNVENVGIRIPNDKFIRDIAKRLKEPLALTSANESNKPSTIHPEEFSTLWPHLGGVFYSEKSIADDELARAGSTVVDLSQPGKYSIIRKGSAEFETVKVLKNFQLEDCDNKYRRIES